MTQLRAIILICMSLLLPACSGGAVVFAPTPLPPELTPNEFTHPSGAFSVLLPRTWSLHEQASSVFASASFSPPESEASLVQISVVNLGRDISTDELGELMTTYQTQVRPDIERYTEQDRQAMGDGSWRMSGLRQTLSGDTQQLNTFIQRSGTLFLVMDVIVPQEATLRSNTQTIINTLAIAESDATVDLPVADLTVLSGASVAPISVVNLSTWTTPTGIFYVTGEVRNSDDNPISELPVRVQLLTTAGDVVADAGDIVMGHAIESGGFAPFSVRFGQGQPSNASQYQISLGADNYTPQEQAVIGFPTLSWTDETQSNADGALFITGSVTNTGTDDLLSPRAIVTLFDESGRVIAAGFADANTTILPAGESADFTVLISELGGAPANYVVNVQALPCDASCE
ncbi:MAG: FxLYD domain-containing protein [Chloroflexota bacterium]